jgi:very-short-patch-repair endonuclease
VEWTDQARRQGGIISRPQLIRLGLSSAAINGMLYRNRLKKTHSVGVYRVPGAPHSADAACWTATLATKSPLSYLSAAELWDVPVPGDDKLHITRFDRQRLVWPPGVRIHRVLLDTEAVTERRGLAVTTRTETLLDCLGWLRIGDARTLADRAKQQQWLTAADIERRLEHQPGRWGNRQLKALLTTMRDGAHSEAERRLHRLLRSAGISGWQANLAVAVAGGRYEIDVAFTSQKLAVEVDGYGSHSGREAFQRDRTKTADLAAAGWTVLRFTWADLVDRPGYVIARITSLLAR